MTRETLTLGHSPDPDDAFMFYALAKDKLDTGPYRFTHGDDADDAMRLFEEVVAAGHQLLKKKARATRRTGVVTPSSSRPTCTIPPTSICSWMRCARPSRPVRSCARTRV